MQGPTCIIIRCMDEEHTVLGAYSANRWKEHNTFYGEFILYVYVKGLFVCGFHLTSSTAGGGCFVVLAYAAIGAAYFLYLLYCVVNLRWF